MIVERDWHNTSYKLHFKCANARSVNFDMGLGTNSTNKNVQKLGYLTELLAPAMQHIAEDSLSGGISYWDSRFKL